MSATQARRIFAGGAHFKTNAFHYRGGLFRKEVGDGPWESLTRDLPDQVEARVIRVHPTQHDVLYVGTQDGVYRSTDGGSRWERLGFPEKGVVIWSLEFHPTRPEIMYAGAAPFALWRSTDGGNHWKKVESAISMEHCPMAFPTRGIGIAVDPAHPDDVYAALEVSGVMLSRDAGETWQDLSQPLIDLSVRHDHLKSRIQADTDASGMLDSHAIVISPAKPGRVFLAVRMGIFTSDDYGASWKDIEVGRYSPLTYCRAVIVSKHDPKKMYAGLSPASRSHDGSLFRTLDLGETWSRYDRGIKANATMMYIAEHPTDPKQVCCISRCGQVFNTLDDGQTWSEWKLPDNVEDTYTVACI